MDWEDRLICVKDKTILRGNFLIDCDPAPENSGTKTNRLLIKNRRFFPSVGAHRV